MGVSQQVWNRQLVRTAGQAVPTLLAGAGINGFPPVTRSPDEVVTLLAEGDQVMADGQIA